MDDLRHLRKPLTIILLVAIALQVFVSYVRNRFEAEQLALEKARALEARTSTNDHGDHSEAYHQFYCSDIDMIRFVQKLQLKEARLDVFGSDQKIYDGEQHLFYDHSFGSVEVRALQGSNPVGSLVYYRIWKNGNDNIRAHLNRFGKLCNHSKIRTECSPVHIEFEKTSKLCVDHCYVDNSHLNYVDTARAISAKELFTKANIHYLSTRFPFTFVRHPIQRFVSGYTEVEYRLSKVANRDMYNLPLYNKVGSIERFKEFVRMILKADGSKRYLHDKSVEIPHIAPQVGTLLVGLSVEGKRLRQYKLEKFDEEYKRLAKESGFWGLIDVFSDSVLVEHPSSGDPLKTTKAAFSFLNLSLDLPYEKKERVPPVKNVGTMEEGTAQANELAMTSSGLYPNPPIVERNLTGWKQQEAVAYARAICRIYLSDFMCTGYSLPTICTDLAEEFKGAVEDYSKLNKHRLLMQDPSWTGRIYSFLLYIYAETECIFESNPQCITDILYGKDSGVDID